VLPDASSGDAFGSSVALHATTMIVGAPRDDVGANDDQGSAYVYVRENGAWVLQVQLFASDGAAGDGFGHGVAVHGDTVVVGAPGDDVGANVDRGSAYVFVRSGNAWLE
jgi:hypothetical protein